MDVLVEEANHALAARGYARDEAAVYPDEERSDWGVLRGSLVQETEGRRTELLRIVTAFPERDDLVAAKEL